MKFQVVLDLNIPNENDTKLFSVMGVNRNGSVVRTFNTREEMEQFVFTTKELFSPDVLLLERKAVGRTGLQEIQHMSRNGFEFEALEFSWFINEDDEVRKAFRDIGVPMQGKCRHTSLSILETKIASYKNTPKINVEIGHFLYVVVNLDTGAGATNSPDLL